MFLSDGLFFISFSFLGWKKRRQKKIKASGTPAKLSGYLIDEVDIFVMYQANFPASVEAAGQFIRVPQKYSTCPYPGI